MASYTEFQMEEQNITTLAAENILPAELWTKILQFLTISQLRRVQEVCLLFWYIVQRFVEYGLIKSDFYVINNNYAVIYAHANQQKIPKLF